MSRSSATAGLGQATSRRPRDRGIAATRPAPRREATHGLRRGRRPQGPRPGGVNAARHESQCIARLSAKTSAAEAKSRRAPARGLPARFGRTTETAAAQIGPTARARGRSGREDHGPRRPRSRRSGRVVMLAAWSRARCDGSPASRLAAINYGPADPARKKWTAPGALLHPQVIAEDSECGGKHSVTPLSLRHNRPPAPKPKRRRRCALLARSTGCPGFSSNDALLGCTASTRASRPGRDALHRRPLVPFE
jgi:hypothetical protein